MASRSEKCRLADPFVLLPSDCFRRKMISRFLVVHDHSHEAIPCNLPRGYFSGAAPYPTDCNSARYQEGLTIDRLSIPGLVGCL